jgi:lysophospholipase L1-like esterase
MIRSSSLACCPTAEVVGRVLRCAPRPPDDTQESQIPAISSGVQRSARPTFHLPADLANTPSRRLLLFSTWFLLIALSLYGEPSRTLAEGEHWVGTWGCGPQLTEPANRPPAPLANSTLRQFVHTTLGGKQVRVRFSNAYGTNSVIMNSVHLALAAGAGGAGAGEIDPATDKPLSFHGAASAIIPTGEAILSDPLAYGLPELTNLAVTIYFGDISASTITGHPGSRTTSFIQPGNAVSATSLPAAVKTPHWYILTGVDVLADDASQAIVVLGDSITDGRGSTTDGNNRWPDILAQRLHTNASTAGLAVLNMGIGGNGIFGGLGPSAQARFDRDVLDQSGVRWLIVFEGVNDIGGGASAQRLTNAYAQFVDKAHARNLRAYGATITPFGGNGYYTPAHETVRQAVNHWIRTGGKFDAVVDFDAVVRNPVTLTNLQATYDTGDGLHLNPAGHRAMADSIDLSLFTP